jgi:hypothetical protein
MKTIAIIGTDWAGPDPSWIRQPFLDNGRLMFDRRRVEDWKNVFYELGDLAQLDALAVGIRGARDGYQSLDWAAPAQEAYQQHSRQTALMPWFDTVGLPDMVNPAEVPPGTGVRFDFLNEEHLTIAWEKYVRIFFQIFTDSGRFQRSSNGRILIAWWGIASDNGWGFTSQRHAQRLLNRIDDELMARGFGMADHLVDKTWLEHAPDLICHGVHNWFNPWGTLPQSFSLRTHQGVTTGVVVPSFYHKIEPVAGATLAHGLASCRVANADYVFIEGGTDFTEGAELMRDATGDTHKLTIIHEHIALTHAIDPLPPVIEVPMITATLCLRRSERTAHPAMPGYYTSPYPGQAPKVLSVQEDGSLQTRPAGTVGPFESWREEGNRAVFDQVFGFTYALPLVD